MESILLINDLKDFTIGTECVVIMFLNVLLIGCTFALAYGKTFSRT